MKNITDTVLKYDAIFEESEEGGFTVSIPSLPGCISEGDTFEEAKMKSPHHPFHHLPLQNKWVDQFLQ